MSNYLPSVGSQAFIRQDFGMPKEILKFSDPTIDDLVCFKITDFTKHEQECHAK